MNSLTINKAVELFLARGGKIVTLTPSPELPTISNRSVLERVMSKDSDHPVRVREGAEGGLDEHAVYLPSGSTLSL